MILKREIEVLRSADGSRVAVDTHHKRKDINLAVVERKLHRHAVDNIPFFVFKMQCFGDFRKGLAIEQSHVFSFDITGRAGCRNPHVRERIQFAHRRDTAFDHPFERTHHRSQRVEHGQRAYQFAHADVFAMNVQPDVGVFGGGRFVDHRQVGVAQRRADIEAGDADGAVANNNLPAGCRQVQMRISHPSHSGVQFDVEIAGHGNQTGGQRVGGNCQSRRIGVDFRLVVGCIHLNQVVPLSLALGIIRRGSQRPYDFVTVERIGFHVEFCPYLTVAQQGAPDACNFSFQMHVRFARLQMRRRHRNTVGSKTQRSCRQPCTQRKPRRLQTDALSGERARHIPVRKKFPSLALAQLEIDGRGIAGSGEHERIAAQAANERIGARRTLAGGLVAIAESERQRRLMDTPRQFRRTPEQAVHRQPACQFRFLGMRRLRTQSDKRRQPTCLHPQHRIDSRLHPQIVQADICPDFGYRHRVLRLGGAERCLQQTGVERQVVRPADNQAVHLGGGAEQAGNRLSADAVGYMAAHAYFGHRSIQSDIFRREIEARSVHVHRADGVDFPVIGFQQIVDKTFARKVQFSRSVHVHQVLTRRHILPETQKIYCTVDTRVDKRFGKDIAKNAIHAQAGRFVFHSKGFDFDVRRRIARLVEPCIAVDFYLLKQRFVGLFAIFHFSVLQL